MDERKMWTGLTVTLGLFGLAVLINMIFVVLRPERGNFINLYFRTEISGLVHDIQEIAPLIYFEDAYDNEYLKNYRKLTDKAFDDMLDELSWLSKHMVKNNDDAQKFSELTLAARYTKGAWNWLEKENLIDADRYLKVAKEHLQKAKEISQLQPAELAPERRKNDVLRRTGSNN